MRRCLCVLLCIVLYLNLIPAASAAESGYTASVPANSSVAMGKTVTVPVIIGGTNAKCHSVDIQITFDINVLEYVSSTVESGEGQLTRRGGVLHIQIYGKERKTGEAAFSVTFQPKKIQDTQVKLAAAKVDNSAHALSNDAPDAEILNGGITKVTVTGWSVMLPLGFKGASTAYPGKDYTFSKPAGNTDYTVTVKVGGKTVSCKNNGDGTYTIAGKDITGEVVVTAVKKTTGNTGHFTPGTGGTSGNTGSGSDAGASGTATYERLWLAPYVELDEATVFLIAIAGTPEKGMTYAYNGETMFFTKKYSAEGSVFGQDVYLYLQLVKKGETLTEQETAERLTLVKATSPRIDLDPDMNGSGDVDEDDASLAYNVYNAMYWNFDELPMAWFMAADVNLDGVVNVQDADAIIDGRNV